MAGSRYLILWEGPGEYLPIPSPRPGWWWLCLARSPIAAVNLISLAQAARLGRIVEV